MSAESGEVWTILRVLDWTRDFFQKKGVESARADAEVILAHALGVQRVMLYARYDQPLAKPELDKIRALVQRRAKGEPVAYLIGEREFWSLSFKVTPAVLIPRPDTEVLVEVALAVVKNVVEPRIADVGTGSGCIAIALASEKKDARVTAIDRSAAALAIASENVTRHNLADRVTLLESDLLAAVQGPFDLLVANLPYVPSSESERLMREVRDHEPKDALFAGEDGLVLIRRLVQDAPRVLKPGATVVLEGGYDQLPRMSALLSEAGFSTPQIRRDYAGHERVVSAIWPAG